MSYGKAVGDALHVWRTGHNPDGRTRPDGLPLEMAPDLYSAMLRGEISPHEAQREWADREPGHRAFNDQIRRQAGFGYVADTEQTLDPNAPDPQVRDAQTGQFADLGEAARDAGHQPMPGGIVPTVTPAPADANAGLRAAFERVLERRSERGR